MGSTTYSFSVMYSDRKIRDFSTEEKMAMPRTTIWATLGAFHALLVGELPNVYLSAFSTSQDASTCVC